MPQDYEIKFNRERIIESLQDFHLSGATNDDYIEMIMSDILEKLRTEVPELKQ